MFSKGYVKIQSCEVNDIVVFSGVHYKIVSKDDKRHQVTVEHLVSKSKMIFDYNTLFKKEEN